MRSLTFALVICAAFPGVARSKRRPRAADACDAACAAKPLFATAPAADAVDAEVLSLCPARAGARVEPDAVRAFFEKHLDDQRLVQAVAAAAPFAKDRSSRAKWLAGIWSGPARRNAFTHVLCGDDWDTAKLGGLHLEARYAQLEKEGKVCFQGPAHGGKPCRDGQCLVKYRGAGGFSCGVKETGGWVQGLDSLELLTAGTRAYLACCMGGAPASSDSSGRLRDGGRYAGPRGVTFQIWCGERNGQPGIATFYPVGGRPNCGP